MRSYDLTEVNRYVDKYMGILGITVRPRLIVKDNLGSKWLGRCLWSERSPGSSLIEIQKSILSQPRTLERVVAHEMVHHLHFLKLTPYDIQLIKLGIRKDGHGKAFCDDAKIINAVMGKDFVNITSDESDTFEENKKPFFILVRKLEGNRGWGWSWGSRLSPKMKQEIVRQRERGAKVFQVTERIWTAGAKLERFGGFSVIKPGPHEDQLRSLYEGGKEATIA